MKVNVALLFIFRLIYADVSNPISISVLDSWGSARDSFFFMGVVS